jgi:flagellar hook-associated protein 3 FlgL
MTSVSTSAFYDSAIFNMGTLQSKANKLQAEISTGNSIQQSSDNPVGAAQLRSLQMADTLSSANTANAQAATTNLNLSDTALSQVTNIVTQVHTLAAQAASGTLTDTQRASIGTQVSALYQNLVSLANTQDASGHAIFGGQGSGQAYTVAANGTATYVGTASANQLSLGNGMSVTTGVTGPQVLDFSVNGTPTNLLSVVQNLATALQGGGSTTPQAAANASLDQLSTGLSTVTTAQTMVGAQLNWISTSTTIQTQLTQQRQTQEANIGGTDIATAVSQLQQTSTVLQAAQATFVKLANMSLFSLLG